MSTDDQSTELQTLIDRIRRGDKEAQRLLLERAYDRLRRLASKIMAGSFPAVMPRHEVNSIVHETWFRLLQALDKTHPPTVADFFRLAAHKIRQVLLDLIDRERRLASREALGLIGNNSSYDCVNRGQSTYDPKKLAIWTEFHNHIEKLSAEERAVFEMHYYLDISQKEIAEVLNLSARKVSYFWVAATEKLSDVFEEFVESI